MATRTWLGGAQAIQQVNTITPANVNIGNTFTVTINNKNITFAATAGTVANVTAGLTALLQASTEPEFAEITWADGTTQITATGATNGAPFTQTSSATGGTATLTTATATAGSGPNYWSTAANWTGAAVPVNGDDVVIDQTSNVDILYGLSQGSLVVNTMRIFASYTGKIGLPTRNAAGYAEYRPTYLLIGGAPVHIGQGIGLGSGRIKIDCGGGTTNVFIYSTGTAIDSGFEAVLWKGTSVTNAVHIISGSVGIAVLGGETAAVDNLRVGSGAAASVNFRGGTGLSLTTLHQLGGTVQLNNNVTTINKTEGTLTVLGSATCTTFNNEGGISYWMSSGTITTLKNGPDAEIDFRRDNRLRTITNQVEMYKDSSFHDDFGTVTMSAGWKAMHCQIHEIKRLALGNDRAYTVT